VQKSIWLAMFTQSVLDYTEIAIGDGAIITTNRACVYL